MATIEWQELRGCIFTKDEAGEASDFVEVLRNCGMDGDGGWDLFENYNNLSVAKRLVFAEKMPIEKATILLFRDSDERIRCIIKKRIEEDRLEEGGGIIIA